MSHVPNSIHIRGIVNSVGGYSVEADILLATGHLGRASIPIALAPGRREVSGLELDLGLGKLDRFDGVLESRLISGSAANDQTSLDERLACLTADNLVPTTICLAISMAYARAVCAHRGCALWEYLEDLSGLQAGIPAPMVNVFSGGIHAAQYLPFQNIMALPLGTNTPDQLAAAIDFYFYARQEAAALDLIKGISPAGGVILGDRDGRFALDLFRRCIAEMRAEDVLGIGIDVAAEHLAVSPGRYALAGKEYDGDEFLRHLAGIRDEFDIGYVEDPFDSDDSGRWTAFTREVSGKALVVADDLFATNAAYVTSGVATGMMIKLTQVGTVTAAVEAARSAVDQGMKIVTSHRSVETEDTFVSELSIGLGASLQKVGGPIGCDRTAKMNVLLRAFDRAAA